MEQKSRVKVLLTMLNYDVQFFLSFVRAGLWRKDVELQKYRTTDFAEIIRWAQEQSVVGLVAAGLEQVKDVRVPQSAALTFAGEVLQLEQRNKAMNAFVAELIERLRKADIYAILLKGQGIAQCYKKPLWRSSGDVDLFLSDANYQKATVALNGMSSSIEEEKTYNKHISLTISGWSVELHGTLRNGLWKKLDSELDKVQDEVFGCGKVRSWMNGQTQVSLLAADEDVLFVFSHILQHFFKEGIGLRQICDWCRLLWTYRDSMDLNLLEQRIRRMGVVSEWKVFAALAVDYLGMPVEAMPFYDNGLKFKVKASKVMGFVLETGNLGHNRDYSYRQKYSYVVFKAISLWKHIQDFGRYFVIFPRDAVKVTWNRMMLGFKETLKGGRHE